MYFSYTVYPNDHEGKYKERTSGTCIFLKRCGLTPDKHEAEYQERTSGT